MNIRREMIQNLYDLLTNNELDKNLIEKFGEIEKMCDEYFPGEMVDNYMDALCNLEYTAFFCGANMVLDAIAGKE